MMKLQLNRSKVVLMASTASLALSQVGCDGCGAASGSGERPTDGENAGAAGVAGAARIRSNAGNAGVAGNVSSAGRGALVDNLSGSAGIAGRGSSGIAGGGAAATGPCAPCIEQHRSCDPLAAAPTCGACLPTFVASGESCVCPGGQVATKNVCSDCADNFIPTCNLAAETGQIVKLKDNSCICDTKDGYFHSLDSHQAELCDADGDGWVNDTAQPAIESADAQLAAAAKCIVRRITNVVLVNAAGKTLAAPLSVGLATTGLPLYESARNDGASAATQQAAYGANRLSPRVLNSLTKACYTKNGDSNDNGVPDIKEWTGTPPTGGRTTRNSNLASYYKEYLRFSAFLELYEGWFVAPNQYVIQERSRVSGALNRIPQRYPSGVNAFWEKCSRHIDGDYANSPKSRAGGDLSEFGDAWGGMTQASQFKCVELVSQTDYASQNRQSNPELVFWSTDPAGFARLTLQGGGIAYGCKNAKVPADREVYDWTPNSCSAAGTTRVRDDIDPVNPSFADIGCDVFKATDAPTLPPGVYWMSVGYENYACSSTDKPTAAGYVRGCVNECVEQTVIACPNFDPTADPNSGRFTCDDENRAAYGKLECGCGRHYGGKNCEIGCPGDNLFTSSDFSIETRKGYWACGQITATSGEQLVSPANATTKYVLRGYVPVAPADGTVLKSADGKIRLEAR